VADLSWAIWLAVPIVITGLASLLLWWRARPERPLRTAETISGHQAYLDALQPVSPITEGLAEAVSAPSQDLPG
jgi:hypothetical protein